MLDGLRHTTRTSGGPPPTPSSTLPFALLSQVVLLLGLCLFFRGREQRLYDLAHRDPLTLLGNRRALNRDLTCRLRVRPGSLLALIDIDGLKRVNDALGHAAGDDLLRTFAQELAQALAPRGRVYRLSGDEFAVLLNRSEPETLVQIVAAVTRQVQEVYPGVGASVGTAGRNQGEAPGDWLARADQAMYRCKRRTHARRGQT